MKTYELEAITSRYRFWFFGNGFGFAICRENTPFEIPESASKVWVEVRKSPARGYVKAEFVHLDEEGRDVDFFNIRIGDNIFITEIGLDEFAVHEGLTEKPFYFCMYYE